MNPLDDASEVGTSSQDNSYIGKLPVRATRRGCCDREGFYLEGEEKRQPFGD
jgi:hypothetical protein